MTRLPNPNRRHTITQKIDRSITGLNGSIFVHVEFQVKDGRSEVVALRMGEKGKDGSTLDKILVAISEATTSIIREELAVRP